LLILSALNNWAKRKEFVMGKSEQEKVLVKGGDHPLSEYKPVNITSFEDWLERWNEVYCVGENLGLLHCLQNGEFWRRKQRPDVVSFLLEIADGYTDNKNFFIHPSDDKKIAENRRLIAEKAFKVLCLRFFKDGERRKPPLWWWMLAHRELFQKVLWFVRPAEFGLRNHYGKFERTNHPYQIFESFLEEFSRLGWKVRRKLSRCDREKVENIESWLIEARPKFIEILAAMDNLCWLEGRELDEDSLQELRELAMNEKYFLPPTQVNQGSGRLREPESLEEALLGGSVAAKILILHRIRQKEENKLRALYKKSKRKQEEKEKQKKLKKIKEQKEKLDRKAQELEGS